MKPNSNSFSRRFYNKLYLIASLELLVFAVWSLLTKAYPSDSETYFTAFQTIIGGKPDHLRTPLYPLIAGGLRALFGTVGGLLALYIAQSALFVASIRWFGELVAALVPDRRAGRVVTAIYALYPGPLSLCSVALTEAFALAATVGLLLLLYRAFSRNSVRYAAWTALLMTAMIMLRPALLYIPLALGLFWIVVAAMRKVSARTWLTGLASVAVTLGALTLYNASMKTTYGISGPSSVSGANNYFTVRHAGILYPEEIERQDLRAAVDSMIRVHGSADLTSETVWSEVAVISSMTEPRELNELTSSALKAHAVQAAKYLAVKRMCDVADADCVYGGCGPICPPLRAFTRLLSPNNGAAFLMLLVLMILLAGQDLRRHSFSTFTWFLCGLFIVIYATITIGAQNEYPRLLIPNYPVLLILAARLFSILQREQSAG
ncbi:MAG: glycosyltransferase family 39 protein [Bacteroides sp.]|nr:glycosyltransferase family 39 protein [Bacteroides sp.]MCM1379675.1 glycosyltransferase family 39 protein [Bacteroides sp.]MCM1445943.1 glycosyltransferase family 39 protein [Prevotella sp.]